MTSFDFICLKINELQAKMPSLSIRYQYDRLRDDHIVEVLPAEVYNDNYKFAELETGLSLEFMDQFPDQNLMFVTEGSLIEVESVDFEIDSFNQSMANWYPPVVETTFSCGDNQCGKFSAEYNYDLAA